MKALLNKNTSRLFNYNKILPAFLFASSLLALYAPAQALDIKQEQINGCVKGTVAYKVADKATANKLCKCTVNVRSKMTLGQIWEIESFAQSGKDPSTLSYAKRMQNELQQCTKGLTLKPPQQPAKK